MQTLALIFGGDSCEHDVSVITAFMTLNTIKNDYYIYPVYLKNGSYWTGKQLSDIEFFKNVDTDKLNITFFAQGKMFVKKRFGWKQYPIDCVLVCAHGGSGENGGLSGYLDIADLPYTCSGVFGSSVCMDKVYTKILLEKLKFPVVTYRLFRKGYKVDKLEELGYPLIVKPARCGSSVGISFAANREELEKGIEFGLQFDDKLLIEKGLTDFHEYNCAACEGTSGIVVSEVEEPIFNKDFLDFYDKYQNTEGIHRVIPAEIDDKLRDRIKRITREIYLILELKGAVRVDYLYSDKKLFINEINTVPGSLALYLFGSEKGKGKKIIKEMVDSAIREHKDRTDYSSEILKNYTFGAKFGGIKK